MSDIIDHSSKRLWSALGASVVVNGVLWRAFGSAIMTQPAPPPQAIEISRVVLSKTGKTAPKIVTRKQIARKVARIQRQIERRKPRIKPILDPIEREIPKKPVARPRMARVPQAPDSDKTPPKSEPKNTQGAHNRTLSTTQKAPENSGFVKPGGQSDLGKPMDKQNFGEQKTTPKNFSTPAPQAQPSNPPSPAQTPIPQTVDPTPTPRPTATTPPPTPRPTATPRPTSTPEPEPTSTPRPRPTSTPRPQPTRTPRPEPTSTPKPRGATRDAVAVRQPQPRIPDELRDASFKSSVRVTVVIDENGNSSPSLRGTSGNAQIDALVLAALRRWKWKPALENGVPIASTKLFRFDLEVR